MPDWSYQTILRPWLFSKSPERSRDLTLAAVGRLSRLPFGPALIDLLGHMRPPVELAAAKAGIAVCSPVGLGPGIDPNAVATSAFARFGFGFIEVGPVAEAAIDSGCPVGRDVDAGAITLPGSAVNPGVESIAARMDRLRVRQPVGFRLVFRPGSTAAEAAEERCRVIERLAPAASFFTLDMGESADWTDDGWTAHLAEIGNTIVRSPRRVPLWIAVPPDIDWAMRARHIDIAIAAGVEGLVIGGGILDVSTGRRNIGAPERSSVLASVAEASRRWGDHIPIIAGGGIVEPIDAMRAIDAGASLVQIDAGLVFSGPGLPKRTNEALLGSRQAAPEFQHSGPLVAQSWFWLWLLGLSMFAGGAMAAAIAATRVVLPYDEAFIGMGPSGIRRINNHLLNFMTHDRVTLAGTMMSIGVLYAMLAWHGVRRGAHWAWSAIMLSASIGFASFFLFLGFGYFDPLHAFVSAILFVFYLLALRGRPSGLGPILPDLVNDRAWKRSQWGQLLFVVTGIGLILAGIAISGIGVTRVFIPTDLMFLNTTREAIVAANAHLVPLIAHDRAGFGGALWSDGIAVLLLSLWGFRRSARWVWWTLMLASLPGFVAALGVHIAIGYMHFEHLFPVYLSIAMFVAGLTLSREYLCFDNGREAVSYTPSEAPSG